MAGLADRPKVVACLPTVIVIGIVKGLTAPAALTVIDPLWIPGDRSDGFTATDTVFVPEVDPNCGPTANQELASPEAV